MRQKRELSTRLADAGGTLISIGVAYICIAISWWVYPPGDPSLRLAVVGGILIGTAVVLIIVAVIHEHKEQNREFEE